MKAHVALFLVALIYGANYSIAKEVLDDGYLQPLGFILLRVVSGFVLFWFFHLTFVRERVSKKDLGLLFLCGLFGVTLNQSLFFSGLKLTTPINASLIMTTTPILVLLISNFMLKERITWIKLLGIGLGAAGAILLIAFGRKVQFNANGWLGDLMVFLNASSYGIYLVLVKPLMKKYQAITIVKWVFTFGFLLMIPIGLPELLQAKWSTFGSDIWLAIAYVLLCTTFLAYLLNAYALKTVTPSVVSIYIYLQPLLAAGIAILLAKDQLTGIKVTAGILIFIGVALVSGLRIPKKSAPTST